MIFKNVLRIHLINIDLENIKQEKITPQTGAEMFNWHWYIYLAQ